MYIVGEFTAEEESILKKRGWILEQAPSSLGYGAKAVFVDNDAFKVMSGPDWEKGPKEIEVSINAIHVTTRQVKIPVICPKCEQPFSKEGALQVWGYSEHCRESNLDRETSSINEGDFIRDADNFVGPTAIHCSCGHELINGGFTLDDTLLKSVPSECYWIDVWSSQDCADEVGWILYDHYTTCNKAEEAFDTLLKSGTYAKVRIMSPKGKVIFSTNTRKKKKKNAKRVR